jgi:hypothetical protein
MLAIPKQKMINKHNKTNDLHLLNPTCPSPMGDLGVMATPFTLQTACEMECSSNQMGHVIKRKKNQNKAAVK